MPVTDLGEWLDEYSAPEYLWYVKRLSGNDTLANESHQAGPYVPRDLTFELFPTLNNQTEKNPRVVFDLYIDSHADHSSVTVIWYNNRFHVNEDTGKHGTRNEVRITGFGGISSPLLDPESTGALTVFAFGREGTGSCKVCHVWVCGHPIEEELIEERIGLIEPGQSRVIDRTKPVVSLLKELPVVRKDCRLDVAAMPNGWIQKFPTAMEIVRKAIELKPPQSGETSDDRLLKRRACEDEIFYSIEDAIELPEVQKGFTTLDAFVERAKTVLQRRKARSSTSLELHAREIFMEEGLRDGIDFTYRPVTEDNLKPAFIFPSVDAYQNPSFPESKLMMLAVRLTFKDRWQSVVKEAGRIKNKHLLTIQEGISQKQFEELRGEGVILVVPKDIISSYHRDIQPHILSFESFIGDVRMANV